MEGQQKAETLAETVQRVQQKAQGQESISLGEIIDTLSKKGRLLIFIVLSLPFCQPIQIPGVSIPFGITIVFLSFGMLLGKNLWLPRKILAKKLSAKIVAKITDKALWFLAKLQKFSYHRISWLCHHLLVQIVYGFIFCLLGLFLALPIPIPLSNVPASWAILLLSLGILEGDGVFVLLGLFFFLLTAIILIPLFLFIL